MVAVSSKKVSWLTGVHKSEAKRPEHLLRAGLLNKPKKKKKTATSNPIHTIFFVVSLRNLRSNKDIQLSFTEIGSERRTDKAFSTPTFDQ